MLELHTQKSSKQLYPHCDLNTNIILRFYFNSAIFNNNLVVKGKKILNQPNNNILCERSKTTTKEQRRKEKICQLQNYDYAFLDNTFHVTTAIVNNIKYY